MLPNLVIGKIKPCHLSVLKVIQSVLSVEGLPFGNMGRLTVDERDKIIKFHYKNYYSAVSTFSGSRAFELFSMGLCKDRVYIKNPQNLEPRYCWKCSEKSLKIISNGLGPVRGLAEDF